MSESSLGPFGPDKRQVARRAKDIPPGLARARHRAALAVARQPVLAGMALATLLSAASLFLVLQGQGKLADANSHIARQQSQITQLVAGQIQSRAKITGQFCRRINVNARASNRQTDTVDAIIMTSVRQSRVAERLYVRYHLPPYAVRLAEARRLVRTLVKQKVPVLNCRKLVASVQKDAARIRAYDGPH